MMSIHYVQVITTTMIIFSQQFGSCLEWHMKYLGKGDFSASLACRDNEEMSLDRGKVEE